MVNYPHHLIRKQAVPASKKVKKSTVNFANRGMSFEAAINETNNYYLSRNIAVIHKNQHRFKLLKLIIRKEAVPKL